MYACEPDVYAEAIKLTAVLTAEYLSAVQEEVTDRN